MVARNGSTRRNVQGEEPAGPRGGRWYSSLIGAAGLVFGQDLAFGSAARMGPGYFPTMLSCLIIAIGLVLALKSLATDGPPIEPSSSARCSPSWWPSWRSAR